MITIGADRFRSRAAASPDFGAGSGGDVNDDIPKRLDSIERAILSMQTGIVSIEKALIETRTKLDTVLPHLATKAELEAINSKLEVMQTHLIKWVIGTAISGAAIAAAITTLASHVTWH
jgi:hypothetical protein